MHTLFMIEISVRETLYSSGILLALFLIQKFYLRKENEPCSQQLHLLEESQKTLSFNPAREDVLMRNSALPLTKAMASRSIPIITTVLYLTKRRNVSSMLRSKKVSQITVIGNLDVEEYVNPKNNAKGINLNVTVYDWDYVSLGVARQIDFSSDDSAATF
jgi:hypothetical protein